MTEQQLEVIPEKAGVVIGGPLDPTSPEGQPPEGQVVGGADSAPISSEPLYRGLTGDIKTQEDLKVYAKHLEDLFVQTKAQQTAQTLQQPIAAASIPGAPAAPQSKERFSELIFSKPEEAFEVAVAEAQSRMNQQLDAERRKDRFWEGFYEKNADLKRMNSIVQSIVKERANEVSLLRTETEVSEFLSRETRKVIDLVKKETGFTETKIPSQNAVTMGGSREPVPQAPQKPMEPINFAEQIRRLKPRGGKTRPA